MTYSSLATQADTPTAGPNAAYMQQVIDNFAAIRVDRVGAIIRKTGTQTITPAATPVAVTFDVEDIDHGGCANLGTNNDRITVPTSMGGRWAFGCTADFHITNNGVTAAYLYLVAQGTVISQDLLAGQTTAPGPVKWCGALTMTLNAADTIQLFAVHTTLNNQIIGNTEVFATLWAWRLSA